MTRFHQPINASNGTFSQPESTSGACRDCDARNCFDARTISDTRSSNDARTECQIAELPEMNNILFSLFSRLLNLFQEKKLFFSSDYLGWRQAMVARSWSRSRSRSRSPGAEQPTQERVYQLPVTQKRQKRQKRQKDKNTMIQNRKKG